MATIKLTTQAQVRKAFWEGYPQSYKPGKKHNDYSATLRSEFVEFVDMLHRNGHISDALADRVTLG